MSCRCSTVRSANDYERSTDDTMALQYQLYRPDDPMCCPTAGATTVRFAWNGTTAAPLDRLPSTGWNAPAGRR